MILKFLLVCLSLQTAHVLSIVANENVTKNTEIELQESTTLRSNNNSRSLIEILGSFTDGSSICGDTLRGSSGAISYKQFVNAAPNERCVWIVRSPSATLYTVTLFSLGIPSSVIIQGFSHRGHVNSKIQTAASTAPISITNSAVLVITFYTGSTVNGRGFSLRYSGSSNADRPVVRSTSEELVVPGGIGHIKYPAGTKLAYGNDELSPFVFTPVPGTGVDAGFEKTDVIYIRNKLDNDISCWDSLKVFTFDTTVANTNKWIFRGEICAGVDSEVITNNDLILIVFQSDSMITGAGFHLYSRIAN